MASPGQVAAAVGIGLAAGLAGTAAMTVSSTVEMKIRGRAASSAPAQAAGKVLGVKPEGERENKRFATLVHWGYGTGWGAARGILSVLGLACTRRLRRPCGPGVGVRAGDTAGTGGGPAGQPVGR